MYGPFKSKPATAFNDWLLSNPGKVITIKNIASLSKYAFLNSFTPQNIISSFKNIGNWPVNGLIFNESDFEPSDILDRTITARPKELKRTLERQILSDISNVQHENQNDNSDNNKKEIQLYQGLSTSKTLNEKNFQSNRKI